MKFSEQWLREWVNPQIDTQELMDQITMAGLEVDGFEPVAGRALAPGPPRWPVKNGREAGEKLVKSVVKATAELRDYELERNA